MNDLKRRNYPELLIDLAAYVAETLKGNGLPTEQAANIGFEAAENVRKNFSGHPMYWPKGVSFECDERDAKIFCEFNGRNVYALAKKYELTEVRIYQIVKRMYDAERTRVQPDLFGMVKQ